MSQMNLQAKSDKDQTYRTLNNLLADKFRRTRAIKFYDSSSKCIRTTNKLKTTQILIKK